MIDLIIKKYSRIKDRRKILKRIKFYAFLRLSLVLFLNLLAPIYFALSRHKKSNRLLEEKRKQMLIISLTTFPARIKKISFVIECMLRQTEKPDKIILWLSKDQFPIIDSLPKRLLDLRIRGLEIRLTMDDLKSHKKYFFTLKEFPKDLMITIDDDFFYPSNLVEDLNLLHSKFPDSICCERAHLMSISEGKLLPYTTWKYLFTGYGPSREIFQTSGGGTLYPPNSLSKEVMDKDIFMKICENADDVWLNINSQIKGTSIVKSSNDLSIVPILNFNNTTLSSTNVYQGQNDVQIEKVRSYFFKKNGIDPLIYLS